MIKLGLYQHYRGNYYQVVGVARHEGNHEALVVYQSMQGDFALWAREITDFQSSVVVDGKEMPRFKFIKETLTTIPTLH